MIQASCVRPFSHAPSTNLFHHATCHTAALTKELKRQLAAVANPGSLEGKHEAVNRAIEAGGGKFKKKLLVQYKQLTS